MSFLSLAFLNFSFKLFHGDRDTAMVTSQQNHFSEAGTNRPQGKEEMSSGESDITWPLGQLLRICIHCKTTWKKPENLSDY